MDINRLLTNLCSKDLEKSKDFYCSLFNFKIGFDSDWFVHLVSEGSALELGIITETSDIVPEQARGRFSGAYLTFVVDDVDKVYARAKELNYNIVQESAPTPYGQKRMVIIAPEGTVCDVSSPTV